MISRNAQAYVKQREKRLAESIDIVTEELNLKVGTDDVITSINASTEGISIDANRININGVISANGGFMVDSEGNMIASNGTFSGVVNATDGEFTGIVHAMDGEFTGEIYATSGTIDSITATNLTVNSGTFSGMLNAATGTINNVTATNLTVSSGKLDITTSASTTDVIALRYNSSQTLSWKALFSPGTIEASRTDTAAEKTELVSLTPGYLTVQDDWTESAVNIDPPNLVLMQGLNSITITPESNLATLSYTEISTL